MKKEPHSAAGKRSGQKNLFQWHPAFYADMQIELKDDSGNLVFENEHQLATRPMEVDVIIIKKEASVPVHKNIGKIFRKYNLVEYKGPGDYLSIDDFYKVYGYACFYKADAVSMDSIPVEELTITLVCHRYPRKLSEHLKHVRNYSIEQADEGIYYINGDLIPIQLLIIGELSPDKNLWLSSLTDQLKNQDTAKKLLGEYRSNLKNPLYRSVMNIIINANKSCFEEVKGMCEALEELMADVIKEKMEAMEEVVMARGFERGIAKGLAEGRAKGIAEGKAKGIAEGKAEGRAEGIAEGKAKGIAENQKQMNTLILKLSQSGRIDDIVRSASDEAFQQKLFEEFDL